MPKHRARNRSLPAKLLIAALAVGGLASPASAQRGVEFGYQDRIFEQNYVLDGPLSPMDELALLALVQMRLAPRPDGRPPLPTPRILDALKGTCIGVLFVEGKVELTPSQLEIEKAIATAPKPQEPPPSPQTPEQNTPCLRQLILFEAAYADPLATDAQLSRLARHMRQRFDAVWVSAEEANDPRLQKGALRMMSVARRTAHLRQLGVDVPDTPPQLKDGAKQLLVNPARAAVAMARVLAEDEPYASQDHQLTALEDATARSVGADRARRDEAQAAAEARRRAEAAQAQAARRAEEERESRARIEADQRREDERQQKEEDRQRRVAENDRLANVRQLKEQLRRIDGDLDEARSIARVARHPMPEVPDNSYAGRLLAKREKLQAKLRELEALAPTSAPAVPDQVAVASVPPGAPSPTGCRIGQRCPVLELTLFCRTPPQLNAVLSQRPGRERKQALDVLTASGDCRSIRRGETLLWTAPIITIEPQGEESAELVPGTLADGTAGVMLKDGVLPRVDASTR